jgi:hypothetical protein
MSLFPEQNLDIDYWLQIRTWNSSQAACLIAGIPVADDINERWLDPRHRILDPTPEQEKEEAERGAKNQYAIRIVKILDSAISSGELRGQVDSKGNRGAKVAWQDWLDWAIKNEIEINDELLIAAKYKKFNRGPLAALNEQSFEAATAERPDEHIAWQNYDGSKLPTLLLHDTWTTHFGVALLCDLDPNSVGLKGEYEKCHVPYTVVQVLSMPDGLTFDVTDFTSLNVDDRKSNIEYYSQEPDDDEDEGWQDFFRHQKAGTISANDRFIDLANRAFESACEYQRIKSIFDSHPAHAHGGRFSPRHFIDWAHSKNIDIPWLEWAQDRGFIDGTAKATEKIVPSDSPTQSATPESVETKNRKEQEIAELRKEAIKVATKLKRDGIHKKHITVIRICEDLLDKEFSDGKPFISRWGTVDGMRSHLKGEHSPTKSKEFRDARPNRRSEFNPYKK